MSRRVLTIVHQKDSTWGKVGEFLLERGFELDRCCPCVGGELPASLDGYSACVVFGGPQSANDDHDPGIRGELDWLERTALPAGIPVLGICLGAQQIARVLGASVGPHPDGQVEIGYAEVHPTQHGEAFLAGSTTFYQWHSETFGIPSDAVHLAHNEAFSGQAFRYRDNVFAIEFHPEMTLDMVVRWCGFRWRFEKAGVARRARPRRADRRLRTARPRQRCMAEPLHRRDLPAGRARDDGCNGSRVPQGGCKRGPALNGAARHWRPLRVQ